MTHKELGIPESFNLCGLTINVELREGLTKETKQVGVADYPNLKIVLDPTFCPKDAVQQTMVHEAVHFIFWIMGEDEMRDNEKLVDMISQLAYQAIKTGGYKI